MPEKTIVVVDDEPHMVDMISTFLQIKGYQPRGAYSGEDGVVMVQIERPDALLLDLMLPDIDGFQVCQKLRAIPDFAALPILIVSARVDPEARQQATAAGANGYLTKPVDFPTLMSELERLFAAPPVAATPAPVAQPAPSQSAEVKAAEAVESATPAVQVTDTEPQPAAQAAEPAAPVAQPAPSQPAEVKAAEPAAPIAQSAPSQPAEVKAAEAVESATPAAQVMDTEPAAPAEKEQPSQAQTVTPQAADKTDKTAKTDGKNGSSS